MANKESAVAFLRLASSGRVRAAYEQYIHPQFMHHNAYFPGDRESLAVGMEQNAREFPQKKFEVLRALGEDDFVAVHSRIRLMPDNPWIAVIYIFRFAGTQIIESWEVGQEVPTESPNKNGAF